MKKFKVRRSWFGVTQILCGLMGLVMNIETFIFFPQFLLEWRGDGLMIYLLVLALIGVPIFLMENIIGRVVIFFFLVVAKILTIIQKSLKFSFMEDKHCYFKSPPPHYESGGPINNSLPFKPLSGQ